MGRLFHKMVSIRMYLVFSLIVSTNGQLNEEQEQSTEPPDRRLTVKNGFVNHRSTARPTMLKTISQTVSNSLQMSTNDKKLHLLNSNMPDNKVQALKTLHQVKSCSGHTQCDVTNYERCIYKTDDGMGCHCLKGYARSSKNVPCQGVRIYQGQLKTLIAYHVNVLDRRNAFHRRLIFWSKDTLLKAMSMSKYRGEIVDIDILGLTRNNMSTVSIDFNLLLRRSFAPSIASLQLSLRAGISSMLLESYGDYKLVGTSIIVANNFNQTATDFLQSLKLIVPSACERSSDNYCDPMAICSPTLRSFICTCPPAYDDISYDKISAPGEQCKSKCVCYNGGTCVKTGNKLSCKCPDWFLGKQCEIDAKYLLIGGVCAVFVLLIVVVLLIVYCVKYRAKSNSPLLSRKSSLAESQLTKLPRTWLDEYYALGTLNTSFPGQKRNSNQSISNQSSNSSNGSSGSNNKKQSKQSKQALMNQQSDLVRSSQTSQTNRHNLPGEKLKSILRQSTERRPSSPQLPRKPTTLPRPQPPALPKHAFDRSLERGSHRHHNPDCRYHHSHSHSRKSSYNSQETSLICEPIKKAEDLMADDFARTFMKIRGSGRQQGTVRT